MAERFRLGGADAAPAITIDGRTTTYGDLRTIVEAAATPNGVVRLAGLDLPTALGTLFAAADAGVPVLVGAAVLPDERTLPDEHTLPDGTFLLVSTSGSSGSPRLLARSAASWASSFRPLAELAGLSGDDTVLLTGPLESTLHLFAAVHTLWLGAHLTDDPSAATAVHAVPTVLDDLLRNPPPHLRTAVVAGAALPPATERRALDLGLRLVEYYGAAELSFVAARIAPDPMTPFPGVRLRIVAGEIWVDSPYVALARVGEAVPLRRMPDGFVTVGDLGRVGLDGELTLLGRGDAAVTTGGHTVLVEDVEAVLMTIPGVREAAVVGTPHPRLGQVLAAAVVLEPDIRLDDVRAAARQRLSGPSRPRRWLTPDALPRTVGGKIARAAIAGSVR